MFFLFVLFSGSFIRALLSACISAGPRSYGSLNATSPTLSEFLHRAPWGRKRGELLVLKPGACRRRLMVSIGVRRNESSGNKQRQLPFMSVEIGPTNAKAGCGKEQSENHMDFLHL